MTDPTFALEAAALTVLRASAAILALSATVRDLVPDDVSFPYIELGDGQIVPDPADGFERSVTAYLTLHVYSRKPGRPEARLICGAIVDTLAAASLDLGADLTLVQLTHEGTRYLVEPDGKTNHGVLTFHALIDPA